MTNALANPYDGYGERIRLSGTIEDTFLGDDGECFTATLWDREDVEFGQIAVPLSLLVETEQSRVQPGTIVLAEAVTATPDNSLHYSQLILSKSVNSGTESNPIIDLDPSPEQFFSEA